MKLTNNCSLESRSPHLKNPSGKKMSAENITKIFLFVLVRSLRRYDQVKNVEIRKECKADEV